MKKRIRFTKAELELIIEMVAIAGANPPEGDYQGWDDKSYRTLEQLGQKAWDKLKSS